MEINKAALFQYLLSHISVNVSICVHVYLYFCSKWMNWIELWVYFLSLYRITTVGKPCQDRQGWEPDCFFVGSGFTLSCKTITLNLF